MTGQTQVIGGLALGYVRVSKVGERAGETFRSPELQAAGIESQAAARGLELEHTYIDLDESGGNLERPAFEELLERVEAGGVCAVIVNDLSRLSRSMRDTEELTARFAELGVELVTPELSAMPEGPYRDHFRQGIAAHNQLERALKREQLARVRAAAVERGIYPSGVPPFGYRRGADRHLEPDELAPAVTLAFELRAGGASYADIGAELELRFGISLPASRLFRMFGNRVYLGEVADNGMLTAGAHAALTDADTFAGVQVKKAGAHKRSGTRTLLSGVARCASCGERMTGGASGTGYYTYRCKKRSRHGKCPAPATISAERLDAYVTEAVLDWAKAEGLTDSIFEGRPVESPTVKARAALTAAESELRTYQVAATGLPAEVLAEGLRARYDALRQAERELELARESDVAGTIRTTLLELWPELAVAERRQMIGAVLERVSVSPGRGLTVEERVELVWRDELLEGATVAAPERRENLGHE